MTMAEMSGFAFEEVEAADAPDEQSFWWGMWLGVGYVSTVVALVT
ncbi:MULTISPECIES: hypothetical protein [Bacteria]